MGLLNEAINLWQMLLIDPRRKEGGREIDSVKVWRLSAPFLPSLPPTILAAMQPRHASGRLGKAKKRFQEISEEE